MDVLEILAKWALWLFDAIGLNLLLKKIAQVFDKKQDSHKDNETNQLVGRQRPHSWNI
jgi:hypothetical protein